MSPSRGPWDEEHYGYQEGQGQRYTQPNEQYRGSSDYGYDYTGQHSQRYAEGYDSVYGQAYAPAAPYDYDYDYRNHTGHTPQPDSQRMHGHSYDYEYPYDQRSAQEAGEYSGYAGYTSYSDYGRGRDGQYRDDVHYAGSRLGPHAAPDMNSRRDQERLNRLDDRAAPPGRRGSPVYADYPSGQDSRTVNASRSYSTYNNYRRRPESQYQTQNQEQNLRNLFSPRNTVSSRGRPAHHPLFSHSDRPGSPRPQSSSPPKPKPQPRRTTPTEGYLKTASHPSWHLEDAASQRKLIVLDLNGSLLVRSAHQRRPYQPLSQDPSQPRAQQPLNVRVVHPRPYLSSFVQYILHPENKKWLDTMVWSSAQPHSVDDMVNQCFGTQKRELRAIWARDTLGLTGDEYHKKTQTYKDLAKPWAELPINGSAVSPPLSPTAGSSSTQSHSALTTLLIDDSPVKAALQPYNHLCIPEYVQDMRNHDLRVADAEREWAQAQNTIVEGDDGEKSSKKDDKKERRREARRAEKAKGVTEIAPVEQDTPISNEAKENNGHPDPAISQADAEPTSLLPESDVFDPDTTVKRVIREVVMIDGQIVDREPEIIKRVTREVVMIEGKMVDPADELPSLVEREVAVSASEFPPEGTHVPPNEYTTKALAWAAAADPAPSAKQSSSHRRRRVRRAERREREKLEREAQELKETETPNLVSTEESGSNPAMPIPEQEQRKESTEIISEQVVSPSDVVPHAAQSQILPSQNTQKTAVRSKRKVLHYDQTLLAVIGILDYLKQEGNIAGWMKSGGLISVPQGDGLVSSLKALDDGNRVIVPSSEAEEKEDELAMEAELRTRRARSRTPPTPSGSPSQEQSSSKRRRVDDVPLTDLPNVPSSPKSTSSPSSSVIPASNFTGQQGPEGTSMGKQEQEPDNNPVPDSTADTKMWFERPAVLAFWAQKGREALAALNLDVIVGIEHPDKSREIFT